ncbi:RDD family protein [Cupriavidus sp. BIC8F]|uniref:RDD family protein n=1 Tax=Cupriavidus sp. BIC8F TaxID=3079014 RepID=UPI002915FAAF|nr:RDD family protein [Cupriavidus sp. BIC8F]
MVKTTTQYATYSRRARALFIDSIWWVVLMLFIPVGPSTEEILSAPVSLGPSVVLWLTVLQCVPLIVTGIMWAVWGTSPGKRALGLRIVDADTGEPMTIRQAAIRTLGYLVCFASFGIGFLWMLFNPRRQGLHDLMANTVVVDAKQSDAAWPRERR